MKLRNFFLAVVIFVSGCQYLTAGTLFENITINDNGSGTMKLNYNSTGSILKENKFILGNLPFSDKLADGFFKSTNSTVTKAKLDFDQKQDKYFMTIELEFKDFNKLGEAKAFSDVRTAWYHTDTGTVFTYNVDPGTGIAKNFETQNYVVSFRSPVKNTNGSIKNQSISWTNLSPANVNLAANVKTVTPPKTTPQKTKTTTTNTSDKNTPAGENKEKEGGSCGLFGMELPLILLGGYVAGRRISRRKI